MKINVKTLNFIPIPHTDIPLYGGPPYFEQEKKARKAALDELLQPGAVVRTKDGYYFLLGDTSPHGSQCECCPGWIFEDVVAVATNVVELEGDT